MPERQLMDQVIRALVLGEEPLIGAESRAVRQTSSIDYHRAVYNVCHLSKN